MLWKLNLSTVACGPDSMQKVTYSLSVMGKACCCVNDGVKTLHFTSFGLKLCRMSCVAALVATQHVVIHDLRTQCFLSNRHWPQLHSCAVSTQELLQSIQLIWLAKVGGMICIYIHT